MKPRLSPTGRWAIPLAAGMTMLMPVPGWDLALERQLVEVAIRKACADAGREVSAAQVARALDLLMRAIFRRHALGKALAATWLLGYVGGPAGKLVSGGTAATISWAVSELLARHFSNGLEIDALEETATREAFVALLRARIGRLPFMTGPR
ncbi:MAG: hypothetical protein RIS35_991 [Pseudomonadota bacterium]|jgi:hypothetical protein